MFAQWFVNNYTNGYELDKDITVKGNKVYSPETCLFVTPKTNIIEARAKSFKFKDPNGKVVDVYNLAEFCKGKNISKSNMSQVHLGNASHHLGWTKA